MTALLESKVPATKPLEGKALSHRMHVLAVPHTVSSKEYISCAFTQKVVKFCKMMTPAANGRKHHIIHYGHKRSHVECDEHVTVTDDSVLEKAYGKYDWTKEQFKHNVSDHAYKTFLKNVVIEIAKRFHDGDLILCFFCGQAEMLQYFGERCLIVEPGIGSPQMYAPFCVFESYAIMHYVYGKMNIELGRHYDCVIPNYFDTDDFMFNDKPEDYFLYLGRFVSTKGIGLVIEVAKRTGITVLLAGQGDLEKDGICKLTDLPRNVQVVGFADIEKRRTLLSRARGLFLFTHYIEPFGGTVIEAMLSGTPVITSDWGVFNETVLHGTTGYRCRNIDHLEWAVHNIDKLDRKACREWAVKNYSLERIRAMYEEYFDMLHNVKFKEGLYQSNPDRKEMSWLTRYYPEVATSKDHVSTY
jgi:glycosyltransferase involved in cell wall biosynthesis